MPCGPPLRWPRSPFRCSLRSAESLRYSRSPPIGAGSLGAWGWVESCSQRHPLALGHRADRLALLKSHGGEHPPAAHGAPASLAHEQIGDRHAADLPWVEQDHLRGAHMPVGDAALELGPCMAYPVGARKGIDALPRRDIDRPRVQVTSKLLRGWIRTSVPHAQRPSGISRGLDQMAAGRYPSSHCARALIPDAEPRVRLGEGTPPSFRVQPTEISPLRTERAFSISALAELGHVTGGDTAHSEQPRPHVGPDHRAVLAHEQRLAAEDLPAAVGKPLRLLGRLDVLRDPGVGPRLVALAGVVDHPLERALARSHALDRRHLRLHGEDRLDLERRSDPGARRAYAAAALQELERVDREPHLEVLARLPGRSLHGLAVVPGGRS